MRFLAPVSYTHLDVYKRQGMLRFLGVVAFLSYPQLDLQGFLHLPYHRFLFHTGLLSKGRSYPVENGELVGRFGEIFLTASRCCFPDFTGFAGVFTPLPLAAPFTRRFFIKNRACNRSAHVLSRVRRERRTAFSGLLC